jgi:hypothetical protein
VVWFAVMDVRVKWSFGEGAYFNHKHKRRRFGVRVKSRDTHVIPIPSNQMKKTNRIATLENRETLWGHITNF